MIDKDFDNIRKNANVYYYILSNGDEIIAEEVLHDPISCIVINPFVIIKNEEGLEFYKWGLFNMGDEIEVFKSSLLSRGKPIDMLQREYIELIIDKIMENLTEDIQDDEIENKGSYDFGVD